MDLGKNACTLLLLHCALAVSTSHASTLGDPTRPTIIPETRLPSRPVETAPAIWLLESTLVASGRRIAVINGKLVSEGDSVEGARVISIHQLDAVIEVSSRRITLHLLPDIAVERP